jgi:hypothetical protein
MFVRVVHECSFVKSLAKVFLSLSIGRLRLLLRRRGRLVVECMNVVG